MNFSIQTYSPCDWSAVHQLLTDSMIFHMSIQNPVRFHKQTPKLMSNFLRGLVAKHRSGRGMLFVAKDELDTAVGFAYGEVDKQDPELLKCSVKTGTIEELYVTPEFRGHSVASRLFDEMECWLQEKGVKLIKQSEVHDANLAAKKMYEKRGYVVRVIEYAKRV